MKRRLAILPGIILLLWTLLLVALFSWSTMGEQKHVLQLALRQSRAFFQQIVSTRSWNAAHGGVFVLIDDDTKPNPYLPVEGREITSIDGRVLTKVNPSYMTRQLSEIIFENTEVTFHMTSLTPIRPQNKPDGWEESALLNFKKGKSEEFSLVEESTEESRFRYMAPLYAEESCLACHKDAAVGEIRGGISITQAASPLLWIGQENINRMGIGYLLIGLTGLIGIGMATQQILRKREQAEAANEMKSMFLANMSHDMRTPLTGIVGMSELLRNRLQNGQEQEYASLLQLSASNLLDIVNDITDYSRIESGKMELRPRPFSLSALLDSSLQLIHFACERKKIALSCNVAENVPDSLYGDDFRLRQMLGNLLGNAVKFTDEGSISVQVSSREFHDDTCTLQFSVHDTGVGIPKEQQAEIFKSFNQGNHHTTDTSALPAQVGTGLGLAITKQLVEMMGGTIQVFSRSKQGSTFYFTACFKTLTHLPQTTHTLHKNKTAPLPLRILAADDNSMNRIYIRETLETSGHEVLLAENGRQALTVIEEEYLNGRSIDAVLMDIQMPVMDGIETTHVIRRTITPQHAVNIEHIPQDIPVIAITAFNVSGDKERFLASGMDGYISKPLFANTLLETIAQFSPSRLSQTKACHESNTQTPSDTVKSAAHNNSAPPAYMAVDFDSALVHMGNNPALLNTLCNAYLTDMPLRQKELQKAYAETNWAEVHRLAHAIKNSSAMLCARPLQQAADKLEKLTKENPTDDAKCKSCFSNVIPLLDETVMAIQSWQKEEITKVDISEESE